MSINHSSVYETSQQNWTFFCDDTKRHLYSKTGSTNANYKYFIVFWLKKFWLILQMNPNIFKDLLVTGSYCVCKWFPLCKMVAISPFQTLSETVPIILKEKVIITCILLNVIALQLSILSSRWLKENHNEQDYSAFWVSWPKSLDQRSHTVEIELICKWFLKKLWQY